jgi:branched-chain amino acid transport system substrate-binding protein
MLSSICKIDDVCRRRLLKNQNLFGGVLMKKRNLTLLAIFAVAVLILSACGGGNAANDAGNAGDAGDASMEEVTFGGMSLADAEAAGVVVAPGEPVRVGASIALTGPIPEFGLDISQSYQLSVSDLNAAGGLMGHDYELDIQDGACDGDAATVVANGFAADPTILAVAGGTCTGETLGLAPILQEARIPFVSASATNPAVTSEDCDICNRVALSDALQANVDADYVFNTMGLTKAAVMHDNTDYGLGLAELFQAAFEELGGEVTSFDGIQVGDVDYRPVLTQVSTNEPEVIFFGGYYQEAALIAGQMLETGLEDAVLFSDDGTYGDAFINTAGDVGEGVYASFVAGDEIAEANETFDAAYLEMWGVTPDEQGPFHAQAYDSVQMIAAALSSVAQADDNGEGYLFFDREEVISAVRSTSGLQGLSGTMACNEIGDCGAGGIQIFQVQDGSFVQISGFGLE